MPLRALPLLSSVLHATATAVSSRCPRKLRSSEAKLFQPRLDEPDVVPLDLHAAVEHRDVELLLGLGSGSGLGLGLGPGLGLGLGLGLGFRVTLPTLSSSICRSAWLGVGVGVG